MDWNILISALSLLITALSEAKSSWKDVAEYKTKPIGINVLKLIFILDEIINHGKELLYLVSSIPLVDGEELYQNDIRKKQKELLSIVKKQIKNLTAFNEIYGSAVVLIDAKSFISVGQAIEFLIPSSSIRLPSFKNSYLKAIAWKILEKEMPMSLLGLTAKKALIDSERLIKINNKWKKFATVQFPEKITLKVKGAVPEGNTELGKFDQGKFHEVINLNEKKIVVTYDLSKSKDIRQLIDRSKEHLNEIIKMRQELAQIAITSFSIEGLLKTDQFRV